jgi:hypothetical protein
MHRLAALSAAALVAAACGVLTTETPASPEQTAEQQAPSAPEPPAQPVQRGADAWCARSFCGCWQDATLQYRAQLHDAAGAPVTGVEAICHGEDAAVAQSGADGVLAFEIATQWSPGCKYQRCRNMTLHDPQGRYADQAVTAWTTDVTLEPAR